MMRTYLAPTALSTCSTVLALEVGVVDQVVDVTSFSIAVPLVASPETHPFSADEHEVSALPAESPSPKKYPAESGLESPPESGLAVTVK